MTEQMKDIAECSRDLERSKIEVQLKLFSEQMEYQRQKDHRLYVNSFVANENARFSILKQGEMVNYLAQLSSVLSKSLLMTNGQESPSMPHVACKEDPTSHKYDCNAAPMSASLPTMFPQSNCHQVNNNLNGEAPTMNKDELGTQTTRIEKTTKLQQHKLLPSMWSMLTLLLIYPRSD